MAIPSYVVESQRPRMCWRGDELAALQSRVGPGGSWQTEYDNEVDDYVQAVRNNSPASIINGHSSPQENVLAIAIVAHVDNDTALKNLGADVTLQIIADSYHTSNSTRWRDRGFALAIGFDAFYDQLSSSEKTTVANALIANADQAALGIPSELMTGHSGLEQVSAIWCGLSLHGHNTSAANSILNKSLRFWFGDDVPVVQGGTGEGRISQMRHITADGGSVWSHYHFRNHTWEVGMLLLALANATSYNAWTDPLNASYLDTWEWLLWTVRGGANLDPEALSDWTITAAPTMNSERGHALVQQWVHGSDGRAQMRWLYDQQDAGDRSRETYALEIATGDKFATSTSPAAASPPIPTERLFNPPGIYYFRQAPAGGDDWDYDDSAVWRVTAREFYMMEHTHLDTGAIALRVDGDPLILSPSGYYDDFGGSHGINVYHASGYQSGVPLIFKSSESWQWFSDTVINDGGQQRKKFPHSDGNKRSTSRPYTVDFMLHDAGGEAWRQTREFQLVESNADYSYLHLDSTPAYREFHTDTPKATVVVKYLVIKRNGSNGLDLPALLMYVRIIKQDADFPTYLPFHHYQDVTAQSYGWTAEGQVQNGKVWCDLLNIGNYTRTIKTRGSVDGLGWGSTQFEQPFGDGTNFKPIKGASSRQAMNTKRESVWLNKNDLDPEDHYVVLFMPTALAASEPAASRVWIDEADWYGVDFGSGQEYRIHKTSKLAQGPSGSTDTTPPGEVSSVSTTPADGQVSLSWTNPGDGDLASVCIRHRVKEI